MFIYSVACPNCQFEITHMWEKRIKKVNEFTNEQTLHCVCPICDKQIEFKRFVAFSQPFDIKEIEEEDEEEKDKEEEKEE